jgi:predicted nucleic acid-binding protein
MTDRVVLDASVAIPLVRVEALSGVVEERVRGWRSADAELLVPAPFWLEVSNSLLRRHRLPARAVIAALHQLDELDLQTVDVDRPLTLITLDLAERFGLTTYDAGYLAVAQLADARLFTSDRALLAAAGSRGIAPTTQDRRLSEARPRYDSEPTWPQYRDLSAYLAKLRGDQRAAASDRRAG